MLMLYDDTRRLPETVRDLIPLRRFGALMAGGETNAQRLHQAAVLAKWQWRHLRTEEDWEDVLEEAQNGRLTGPVLWWPARLVPAEPDDGEEAFRKYALLPPLTAICPKGQQTHALLLMPEQLEDLGQNRGTQALERALILAQHGQGMAQSAHPALDLADAAQCLRFLSGTFRTRFFNDIIQGQHTITKASPDRAKMRKEHDYWYLLPPAMQRFFVQPYNFQETPTKASYDMERLGVPDASVLWTHGAFSKEDFQGLLDRLRDFLLQRSRTSVSKAQQHQASQALYLDKLDDRLKKLQAWEGYQRLMPLLEATTPGGMEGLVARYKALHHRIRPLPWDHLALSHGDLCFSNILYDKRTGLLRLIDPRGGTTRPDLDLDPGYDIAKLSHSILGDYDFIVKGMAHIEIGPNMQPVLLIDDSKVRSHKVAFQTMLRHAGLDLSAVRLQEASLFLSMLPLHTDDPKRVLALALRGAQIVSDLETLLS